MKKFERNPAEFKYRCNENFGTDKDLNTNLGSKISRIRMTIVHHTKWAYNMGLLFTIFPIQPCSKSLNILDVTKSADFRADLSFLKNILGGGSIKGKEYPSFKIFGIQGLVPICSQKVTFSPASP